MNWPSLANLVCAVWIFGSPSLAIAVSKEVRDQDLIRALIPEYDSKIDEYARHIGKDDEIDFQYSAEITERAQTDFAIPDRSYLLAVVYNVTGLCNSCRRGILGLFDLRTQQLLWRHETPPSRVSKDAPGSLRFFRLFPDDHVLSFGYRHFVDPCMECGHNVEEEAWFRPRLNSKGELTLIEIWRGALAFGNSERRGGTPHQGCGLMSLRWPSREYEYVRRDYLGEPKEQGQIDLSGPLLESSCLNESGSSPAAVEIRTVEKWLQIEPGQPLQRQMARLLRLDHFKTDEFPFNLVNRNLSWHLASSARPTVPPRSPDGRLVCSRDSYSLEVRDAKTGATLRAVRMPGEPGLQDLTFESIGWSSDSKLCFAVVRFETYRTLLSFSARGRVDYWEKLLTDDTAVWKDGFVLEPAEPVAEKIGKKSGRK